jgi:acetyl-CoA/propionyl-CoA carboxylase biotin carboxyl carrier protein
MNTRLQVEHPVTEFVTGRDLVADQLRIAAGEALGLEQVGIDLDGHAIEVRLYAEDAEDAFLPATGRIEFLRWPVGDGIRVDAGIDDGDEVGSRFDPMLAKIIAHGDDRAAALDRLTHALDDTVVLGLTTNLRFLRWLVREPIVRDGAVRTDTLDRIWPPDDWATRAAIPDAAWSAAASLLADRRDADHPWDDGWRLNAPARVRLESGAASNAVALPTPGSTTAGGAEDGPHARQVGDTVHLDIDGRSTAFRLAPPPDVDRAARAAAIDHGGRLELTAPMPGQVRAIAASTGDIVAAGAPVVTLEAMKMEHTVVAGTEGHLAEILVELGDQVQRGQILAVIEP